MTPTMRGIALLTALTVGTLAALTVGTLAAGFVEWCRWLERRMRQV